MRNRSARREVGGHHLCVVHTIPQRGGFSEMSLSSRTRGLLQPILIVPPLNDRGDGKERRVPERREWR